MVQDRWGYCSRNCPLEGREEQGQCKTIGGADPDKPCIVPFYIDWKSNDRCVKDVRTGNSWCATEVDHEGHFIKGKTGICSEHCLKQGK